MCLAFSVLSHDEPIEANKDVRRYSMNSFRKIGAITAGSFLVAMIACGGEFDGSSSSIDDVALAGSASGDGSGSGTTGNALLDQILEIQKTADKTTRMIKCYGIWFGLREACSIYYSGCIAKCGVVYPVSCSGFGDPTDCDYCSGTCLGEFARMKYNAALVYEICIGNQPISAYF